MKATSDPGNRAPEIGFGYGSRAPYACDPGASRGRLIPENDSPTRTPFQRDRDRIVHATAFRRLKHKTQVFVANDGDHYRTRLTHTIEVSQIARSLARAFRLDEDLAEAVALAHDLGHTPFGHAGERALAEKMEKFGGFDHNTQSLRIVTELERRYAEFDGLNLSFETLEGIVKHNGPLKTTYDHGQQPSSFILEYDARQNLRLEEYASLEAQCAAIADDIAYDSHDIDDGLRSGFFSIEDLRDLTLVGEHLAELQQRYPNLEEPRLIHEIARRQITAMIEDVIAESAQRIASERPASSDAVRRCGRQLVGFSQDMQDADRTITQFLFDRLYRHPDIMKITGAAEGVVSQLFDLYMERPDAMGVGWDKGMEHAETHARARRVADYLSGMTDTYALKAYKRLGCRPEWVSPLIDGDADFI